MRRIPRLSFAKLLQWVATPLVTLLLAAVASALCGAMVHANGYLLLWGTLAAIVSGTLYPWVSVRVVEARLLFDQRRVREDSQVTARLVIINRWPVPVYGLGITAADDGLGLGGQWIAVGPWRRREIPIRFVPVCRGDYPRSPVWVTCGFPFGIYRARKAIRIERRLIVWPKTVPLDEVRLDAAVHSEQAQTRNFPGHGGDVLGLRPYRRGDPLRLVHWRQTAKHQRLVVREIQATGTSGVRLVLDSNTSSYEDPGPQGQREWAIRAAATFFERWMDRGIAVEMVLEGRPLRQTSMVHSRTQILDALARLGDIPHPPVCEILRGPAPRTTRVVITSEASTATLSNLHDSKLRIVKPPLVVREANGADDDHRSIATQRRPEHPMTWTPAEIAEPFPTTAWGA